MSIAPFTTRSLPKSMSPNTLAMVFDADWADWARPCRGVAMLCRDRQQTNRLGPHCIEVVARTAQQICGELEALLCTLEVSGLQLAKRDACLVGASREVRPGGRSRHPEAEQRQDRCRQQTAADRPQPKRLALFAPLHGEQGDEKDRHDPDRRADAEVPDVAEPGEHLDDDAEHGSENHRTPRSRPLAGPRGGGDHHDAELKPWQRSGAHRSTFRPWAMARPARHPHRTRARCPPSTNRWCGYPAAVPPCRSAEDTGRASRPSAADHCDFVKFWAGVTGGAGSWCSAPTRRAERPALRHPQVGWQLRYERWRSSEDDFARLLARPHPAVVDRDRRHHRHRRAGHCAVLAAGPGLPSRRRHVDSHVARRVGVRQWTAERQSRSSGAERDLGARRRCGVCQVEAEPRASTTTRPASRGSGVRRRRRHHRQCRQRRPSDCGDPCQRVRAGVHRRQA